jgi:hypothetical protein
MEENPSSLGSKLSVMFADDIECSVLFNGDKSRNAVFLAIVSARWHAEENAFRADVPPRF